MSDKILEFAGFKRLTDGYWYHTEIDGRFKNPPELTLDFMFEHVIPKLKFLSILMMASGNPDKKIYIVELYWHDMKAWDKPIYEGNEDLKTALCAAVEKYLEVKE